MLGTISNYFTGNNTALSLGESTERRKQLSAIEDLGRHFSVLHHRNAQLRAALIDGSEAEVNRRHSQFLRVLWSYVRLVKQELHGTITRTARLADDRKYIAVRDETLPGYDQLIANCNTLSAQMLKSGSDFARFLFQVERQIKHYHEMEQQAVYPLYNQITSDDSRNRAALPITATSL